VRGDEELDTLKKISPEKEHFFQSQMKKSMCKIKFNDKEK